MKEVNSCIIGDMNTLNEKLREQVCFLTGHGFYVVPLYPRDKYRIEDIKPTKDPETASSYWDEYPCANIGFMMGVYFNNYIMIDIDVREKVNGMDTIREWEERTGLILPDTCTVETGRKGFHLYYKNTKRREIPSCHLMPGIDIRARYGFGLMPPSVHPNGETYRWLKGNIFSAVDADDAVYAFLGIR